MILIPHHLLSDKSNLYIWTHRTSSRTQRSAWNSVLGAHLTEKKMASQKAEKPVGTQPAAPVKKECGKSCGPKAPASKPAPPKADSKPREPRKKATGSKAASK
ncbi:hypothetical protein K2173_017143 [Erythroxylum novogranatense]|uniref:Uncharacterized protein n=1 Tax=Erythroxylum novogranatense TaxID=1862640 RepID=A0AAV8U5U0_9ROSI|nr:hypothetical protein K2173_017143 [Erythroxylum novogranatense]